MCTFHEQTKVQVCDVAIPHVKTELAGLGSDISFTHMEGEGTMVEAVGDVDPAVFERLVRSGMAAAE